MTPYDFVIWMSGVIDACDASGVCLPVDVIKVKLAEVQRHPHDHQMTPPQPCRLPSIRDYLQPPYTVSD